MIFIKSFLVGGIICAIVQILIDKTKLTPGRIMVGLVCLGVILGAIGIYEPFSKWAGCGATVPLPDQMKAIMQQSLEGNERSHRRIWFFRIV